MKHTTIFIFILCWTVQMSAQNIGINEDGSTPDASAILDIQSNNKGVLLPRLTTAQMNMISSPQNGLLIYNSSTESFWFYDGAWGELNADADSNPNNEIQTLSKTGNVISLSQGGGQVYDAVNDADASPTNELQTLSRIGDNLYLYPGSSSGININTSLWNQYGGNVARLTGNVGIGVNPTSYRLQVNGSGYFSGLLRAPIIYPPGNSSYYLDLDNTSQSLRTPGDVVAPRYRDINGSGTYYLDFSNSSISLVTPGEHRASRYTDYLTSSYYLDLYNSISLNAYGIIRGSRFEDTFASTQYYLDFSNASISLNTAGAIQSPSLLTQSLNLSTGAYNGYILQSDASGNASWVDPGSLYTPSPVTHEVVQNTAVTGIFWTHPSAGVTVSYDSSSDIITVTNSSTLSYWNISIIGSSGVLYDSSTCGNLNVCGDLAQGGSMTLDVSSCTGNTQGFHIMAADETGSITGFAMDVVIYNSRLNAMVGYW